MVRALDGGVAPDGPRPRSSLWRGALAALAALVTLGTSCGPRPGVPPDVAVPPAPFVRLPYVQDVEDDRAVIRWRVAGGASTRLTWRVAGDSVWRGAEVRGRADGDRWAVLEGLPTSTPVRYRVAAGDVLAGPHRFTSAPADTATGPIRVLAFGDSGWGSEAQVSLARRMSEAVEEDRDLAVHVGDVAYPDGSARDLTVRHFRVYAPMLSRVPFRPVPGNHDVRAESGAHYDRAFGAPDGEGRRYWRHRRGRILFVGLDTSSDAARESLADRAGSQWRWLVRTLDEAVADSTLSWTVALTHYPLYSRGAGLSGHGPNEELRQALEPLFLRHGVDLVLAGHEHHYERSHPLREGDAVAEGCGPVHLITGGGGATRFARAVESGGHAAQVDRSHHFVDFVFRPGRAVGRVVDPEGRVIDRFRLQPYSPADPACD